MAKRQILGAVLAGGRSRRFGSDKAEALLAGRPLIAHAVTALAPHVAQVVVCGRDFAGLVTLTDRPEPGLGPLGGLAAALHHAAAHGFAGVLTTGCDMPVFPGELVDALIGEEPATVAGQPLIGWWPTHLAEPLYRHLASGGDRAIRRWLNPPPRTVALAGEALPNINTPDDLAALARRWPPT